MDTANIYIWLVDADSKSLHAIPSYLACIPIWNQMLTTRVAPDDNEKTPCPRMNQKTLVPSGVISSTEFFNSTSTSIHLASNDEFQSVLSL